MKKYKVKLTEWYLKRMPDGKLPVKVGDKVVLIGKGGEVVTDNIQGMEGDPRYSVEEVKIEKKKKVIEKANSIKKLEND